MITTPSAHYKLSDSFGVMSAIRIAGVNMAIWQRSEKPRCKNALNALLAANETVLLDYKPTDNTQIIEGVTRLADIYGEAASMEALAEDIQMLVNLFCGISDASHARIRLGRIENDACRLFHADSLHMRMLCTYAGPGTEWLDSDNARHEELGSRGRTIEETNAAIVIDPAQIRHVAPWHVAVFTGRLRPDTPPLIHRSAPVPTEKEHRIRLCIDLPDACGC